MQHRYTVCIAIQFHQPIRFKVCFTAGCGHAIRTKLCMALSAHMRMRHRTRTEDSAQVHQTLFLLEGGVWGRDYVQSCQVKMHSRVKALLGNQSHGQAVFWALCSSTARRSRGMTEILRRQLVDGQRHKITIVKQFKDIQILNCLDRGRSFWRGRELGTQKLVQQDTVSHTQWLFKSVWP